MHMKGLLTMLAFAGMWLLTYSHETYDGKLKHTCIHNELTKGFEPAMVDSNVYDKHGRRILQATTSKNIRIRVDYSDSDIFINSQTSLQSLYEMSKRILANVKKYFETYLKVNTAATITIPATVCPGGKSTKPVNSESIDLYIYINAENNSSTSYFAAASTCAQDVATNRPIAGMYFLNFASMKGTKMFEYFYFTTYTHEFMHILFFSSSLFTKYKKSDGSPYTPSPIVSNTAGTRTFNDLRYPNLVEFGKSYFKCGTLVGIPLEDGGGDGTAGSHWEKLYLPEDIMNPTIENPAKISPFTIEMIKATGWYEVIGDPSSYYDWGKDDGCVMASAYTASLTCPSSYEYCPSSSSTTKNICSPDGTTKATCSNLVDYFSGCLVKRKMEVSCLLNLPNDIQMGAEEIYGPHSRCIPWEKKADPNVASAECHAVRCIGGKVQFKIKSGLIRTCSYEGEKIIFPGDWQINCPDPKQLCNSFANRCPMDCYGTNGYCLNGGKCFCFTGYSGDDCGTCDGCQPVTDPFILSSNRFGKYVEVDPLNFADNKSMLSTISVMLTIIASCLGWL